MEPNEHQLSSYFHPANTAAALSSPTNGLVGGGPNTQHHQQQQQQHQQHQQLSSADNNNNTNTNMVFTHSSAVPPPPTSAVTSPVEPAKRKRGRPRKYGTPEQALAAKKAATTSSHSSSKVKKEQQQQQQQHGGGGSASPSYSGPTKKSQQLSAIGNSGQGFTPHVINLVAGEDVGDKIMAFMRQSKRDICILSASGSISNASIRQPATSGGNITYEGHFEIISLSGSYVHTPGGKTGGMSVCLSNTNGHIFGGGVGGPLTAAGPVQVIIGTFLIDNKNDVNTGVKMEVSIPRLPSPVGGTSMMNVGFRSAVNSSGRNMVRANDEQQQAIGGSHFMTQGMHGSADWRAGPDVRSTGAYELAGIGGHAAHQSPENGDYDQIPD
ncbi:PREDICTED: putative DNA-binding protein ESCAROLA [Fragaria vesca subsp. vesca]|uniref:putative DNA-binding protein ESCAROLA n=1 Tax=Fragaria vesca subsp. vesca TaxID=101020 RepID=UPI0002C2EC3C|nr:PREDICTED: putative DNA-binding protein ESCAROLA [Fragaria vesca subsp. vesca]